MTSAMTINPTTKSTAASNIGRGRVAVVTGASRGIGRGIAIELGKAGYTVYALGRSSRQNAPPTDQRPVEEGSDLTVESVVEEISSYGNGGRGVAVQIYNACCRAVPYMISTASGEVDATTTTSTETSTSLICLVSSFGGKAYTSNVAYGVGKAAIDRLARNMAIQLKPYNIPTTALYPGLVRT